MLARRDESAAGRVPKVIGQEISTHVDGAHPHAVGVQVGDDVPGQINVPPLDEADVTPAQKREPAGVANRRHRPRDRRRVDVFGLVPEQAQNHRGDRAVAGPSQGQRALQLDVDAVDGLEDAALDARLQKAPGDPHRPDRVRARRADADAEQVEDRDQGAHSSRPLSEPAASAA